MQRKRCFMWSDVAMGVMASLALGFALGMASKDWFAAVIGSGGVLMFFSALGSGIENAMNIILESREKSDDKEPKN